jgi:hypothetical protein
MLGTILKKLLIDTEDVKRLKEGLDEAKIKKINNLNLYMLKISGGYNRIGEYHEAFVLKNLMQKNEIIFEIHYLYDKTVQLRIAVHLSKYKNLKSYCKDLVTILGIDLAGKILRDGIISRIDVWCDFKSPIDRVKRLVARRGVQCLRDQKATRETFYHGSIKSSTFQRVYEIDPDDREDHPHKKNKFTRLELSYQRGKMPIQKLSQYSSFNSKNFEPFKGTKLYEFDIGALNILIKKNPKKHACIKRFLFLRKHRSLMDAINDLKVKKKSFRRDILKRYEGYYHLKPLNQQWDRTVSQMTDGFDVESFITKQEKMQSQHNNLSFQKLKTKGHYENLQ